MAIIRWDPIKSFRTPWPFEEEDWDLSTYTSSGENIELSETDESVIVKVKVPGVEASDIDINFQDGRLWIKAEGKEEQRDEKAKTYRKMSTAYNYVVDLPGVDSGSEPDALLEKGILKLTFNKVAEAKPKKIVVKSK
jgi:HSP20 family protein